MPIAIDWPAKIIEVPQDYLTLVSPGIFQLDLNTARLDLKALEDDPAGMPFPDTHIHVAPRTIAGVTLARVFEIINGYRFLFEDGQYAVNLVGANSNIADVAIVNQVSLRSQNSAGLVQVSSGSGLDATQDSRIAQLWATLISPGVFSAAALANAAANLAPEQAAQLTAILNLAQSDEKIRADRYQKLAAGTSAVILDKDVTDLGDGEFDITEHV